MQENVFYMEVCSMESLKIAGGAIAELISTHF